jgi:8-oxo-dGTP pyrophosphatase MutT (NUDIX family)
MDLSKKPDSVGVFLGLITKEGKVRYQMRIESSSPITGISYKGDFELPGGGAEEKNLSELLTPEGLLDEGIREAKEELGIVVLPPQEFPLYWAPYQNPKNGKIDWAFMIPILPSFWDETAEVKRKIVDLNPKHLDVLGELNLIVSGKKRMYRMGQGALYACSLNSLWRQEAADLLTQVKSDWREIEYHEGPKWFLGQLRKALSLE